MSNTVSNPEVQPKKKPNKLLSFFSFLGGFLFKSLKRSVGAKTNADFIAGAFNLAGGFILSAEQERKADGSKLSGMEKLEKAATDLVKFYAAQSINVGFHNALDIVTSKFNQLNEEKVSKGMVALVGAMNQGGSASVSTGTIEQKVTSGNDATSKTFTDPVSVETHNTTTGGNLDNLRIE